MPAAEKIAPIQSPSVGDALVASGKSCGRVQLHERCAFDQLAGSHLAILGLLGQCREPCTMPAQALAAERQQMCQSLTMRTAA